MEKGVSRALTSSFQQLHLNNNNPKPLRLPLEKTTFPPQIALSKCPTLATLCLQVLGKHFEDIIHDLRQITATFPPEAKMVMLAIARRRKLLNDDVLISLADDSWDILDVSGSEVSDIGLTEVVNVCESLRAVDISCCTRITTHGVSELLSHSHLLETLRCGGCFRSNTAVRGCLGILKPKLNDVAGESWEELSVNEMANNVESLRWLLWPNIDDDSRESLAIECPRIVVNPNRSLLSLRGFKVPKEAIVDTTLDESIVRDINPKTWAVTPRVVLSDRVAPRVVPSDSNPRTELPIAEKFRLAFVERDERLAPKRAKNARQHRRRAEREWMMTSAKAKSVVLAYEHSKSLHSGT